RLDQISATPSRLISRPAVPWTIAGGRAIRARRYSVQSVRSRNWSLRMIHLLPARLPIPGHQGGPRPGRRFATVRLGPAQLPVPPLLDQELLVRPFLDNPALMQHVDVIGLSDGAEPMRNQNHGLARQGCLQALLDRALGGRVQVAG